MRRVLLALTAVATAVSALPALAHPGASSTEKGGAVFGFEQNITNVPAHTGGHSPQIALDRFGDIFVVAAKDSPGLVGLDPASQLQVRASSWAWMSTDNGATWDNLPSSAGTLTPGLAPALAIDDAQRVFVVDTYGVDASLASFRMTGRGRATEVAYIAALATPAPDQRPLLAARGNAELAYLADRVVGIGGRTGVYSGRGSIGGTVATLDGSSENCAAAADHRPKAPLFYAVCTDGTATLFSYVSADGGITFQRTTIGSYVGEHTPAVTVGRDGTVYVLSTTANGGRLLLYRSADRGRRWTVRDVTTKVGTYRGLALAASPNGKLGIAAYYLSSTTHEWYILGGIWDPRAKAKPILVNFADHDPVSGDPTEDLGIGAPAAAFDRGGHLHLAWSAVALTTPESVPAIVDLQHDVFHVASVST